MLSSPLVLASSLFFDSDISHLLSDTQTSSSLRSQQALVDVVIFLIFFLTLRLHLPYVLNKPLLMLSLVVLVLGPVAAVPSAHPLDPLLHGVSAGSPAPQARAGKHVRFDSLASNSALKGSKASFRR